MTVPQKPRPAISEADYQRLSEFRYLIRRFLEFSQLQAQAAGLTPRQHQALLAIKGFPRDGTVTIGELAERLRIRHHSAVELVNRLGEAGLVSRDQDKDDHRRVLLGLTSTPKIVLPNCRRRISMSSSGSNLCSDVCLMEYHERQQDSWNV